MIISEGNLTNLINFIYLNLAQNFRNVSYMVGRAILASKNINIKKISNIIMDKLLEDAYTYISADSTDSAEGQTQLYSPEFLRSLKIPKLPSGELKLKVGIPIMLL